jgi:hypothetical protein
MKLTLRDRSSALRVRHPLLRAALLALAAVAGTPACGKGNDAVACPFPPQPDGSPGSDQIFASGSATGSGLSASFCNAGIQIAGYQGGRVVFNLDSTTSVSQTTLSLPAGAVSVSLTGAIDIGSPAAGVYKSSDSMRCGTLTLSYGKLVAPAQTCGAPDAGNYCSSGCTVSYFCADAAAQPCCVPLANTFVYQAAAATSCTQGPQAVEGSWTLTLTSVTSFGDASSQYGEELYVAHGTLSATLKGTADTTSTANLSLTF